MFTVAANCKRIENTTAVYAAGESTLCLPLTTGVALRRFMAVRMKGEFWCRPEFGQDPEQIPADTVLLVLERADGGFAVVLPVVNALCRTTVGPGLCLRVTTWSDTPCQGLCALWAVGSSPNELISRCARVATGLLEQPLPLRQARTYPQMLEYLGWCSWDAMQIRVNQEGILSKCREFTQKNIPVRWCIFDDMWAEIRDFYNKEYEDFHQMVRMMHASRLWAFEADPYRFPQGLKHCIDRVHDLGYRVGVWFPFKGYWSGPDPDGPVYAQTAEHLVLSGGGHWTPNWQPPHAYAWFAWLMDRLKQAGADFIKVDCQGCLRKHYQQLGPIGQVARGLHNGLEDAAQEYFDGRMINCMGMAPENVFSRHSSAVSRCSDDFLPENRAWFTKHVLQCAYNSLWQGQFYYCDWDMWWTDDGQAAKNALLRAVSGGPVYVSDQQDRSHRRVLMPLVLEDGRILRCDRPAMPTDDCVTVDPCSSGRAMKLQNTAGLHGILAVLDLDENGGPVTADISAWQIPGLAEGEYAVYEHFSGQLTMLQPGQSMTVTLSGPDDCRLYILCPVRDGFAAIGRTDKYISPKTLSDPFGSAVIEPGPHAWVQNGRLHRAEQ